MTGEPLEAATRCLTLLTQHEVCLFIILNLVLKLFLQSKGHIAIVLVGTDTTDNDLADSSGNFSHISLIRPLGPYDWDLLESFDSGFSPSYESGDRMILIIFNVYA